ncbi:N-alkane-inducible cytochrome P450 [Aspergillus violaceofuscus CBS 115571]|uniref:N-alkane-inducible cytochrome P450 n=1 Tax=Aspergillus violaceofuscus (strain CBS 115571) TaxID=1450538 RepID=A0A2V5H071_ASPV1|nr:N-alkane-inducible cytochrome P450 [Aspergillus violaceofuscus CBS 115571]
MTAHTGEWAPLASRLLVTVTTICITSFVYKLVKMRLMFHRLRKQGLHPMPSWNPILGNLPVMAGLHKKGPADAREAELFALLSAEVPDGEAGFYVDVWPFSSPMLVVTSPVLAVEAAQTYDLPKPDVLQSFINPMAGGSDNLFVTNGAHWKKSRDMFNHGFSMATAMNHLPCILEEAEVFIQMLTQHAHKGDTFSLDQLTCRYTMDIIGNVALNTRFHFQEQHNPIAAAMRDTIEFECGIEAGGMLARWNPRRFYRQWQNGRTLDHLIGLELDQRYQEWCQTTAKPSGNARSQSIMDLVIADYMKTRSPEQALDPDFKRWATIQIRLFLFVGHDSEATTIIYALYLLSNNPKALEEVRAEHDRVFGPSSANAVLQTHPEKINQLAYTHAVIKETLRLFPPANGLRGGRPGVSLRDDKGRAFPTEGCAIWIVHPAVHRNPSAWPQPHAFLPERWLVAPDHPLYPPTGGWRPFEHGPRNCIGQNISLLGVKATLAMIVRQFDFHDAYAEYDNLHPSNGGIRTVFEERAYMIQKGAGHPAQGFPCKVTLRKSP